MLAKAVPGVPAPDSVAGGLAYEPKWDGFRCIVLRDGAEVELSSRGSKPLTRYFPEVVRAVMAHLPQRCAIDAEIVVRKGPAGAQRLDWESLSQRIHPADSRVQRLAVETPAELICFDILALGDRDLTGGGILTELFGAPATLPLGPAMLAVESGARPYVVGVRRTRAGRYIGRLERVAVPPDGDRRARVTATTGAIAAAFERVIEDAPEQWWAVFFPIWPDLESGVGSAAAAPPADPAAGDP